MTHPGTVTAVKPGFVTVQIESTSACAACQAHARCGFAESKTKTLDIPTQAIKQSSNQTIKQSSNQAIKQSSYQTFSVGDPVIVTIDHTRGLLATWWAYVVPALLLLAAVVSFSLASLSEPVVILLSLAILALYVLVLYLFRRKLDSHFTLTVSPALQTN